MKGDEPDSLPLQQPQQQLDGQMNVTGVAPLPQNVNVTSGSGGGGSESGRMLDDTSPTTARLLEHRQLLNEMSKCVRVCGVCVRGIELQEEKQLHCVMFVSCL